MSFNGSGTFTINSSGQPVVSGTTISDTVFNALTADLATGLSTCVTKDGQTATTARVPFLFGISSTLTTDSTSTGTGSIITSGGVGITKALWVGTTAMVAGSIVYLGGTSATEVSLRRSSTELLIKLGDGSAYAPAHADLFTAESGKYFLVGQTSNDVLLKKGAAHSLYIRKGDDSAYADMVCGTLTPATLNYSFGGFTGSGSYTSFTISDGIVTSAS